MQQEKKRIAKERDDSRQTIAYLQQFLHKKLGGDNDSLLVGNLQVPIRDPSLSILAPSLQGIPSIAFLFAGRASGSQSTPFAFGEFLFPSLLLENFSYL